MKLKLPLPVSLIKFENPESHSSIGKVQMSLFVMIELLMIFGKNFSKFHLYGIFYLYDILLAALTMISLIIIIKHKEELIIWKPMVALLVLSGAYLVYSFMVHTGPVQYQIRQYAVFIYLACLYIIFQSYISNTTHITNIRFIILIGWIAFVGQILTHIYNYIVIKDYAIFEDYHYLSLMSAMGIGVFLGYIMVFEKGLTRWILGIIALFLSITLGHASAFLSSFVVVIAFLGIRLKLNPWVFMGTLILIMVSFTRILPSFQDVNAEWRLIYWKGILKESINENYGIAGDGFGGPYVNGETQKALLNSLDYSFETVGPDETYLGPPNNFVILMIHHLGLVPGLIILVALLPIAKWFFSFRKEPSDKRKEFIFLIVLMSCTWASFNAVLPNPHSSAFFWLIFFTAQYEFNFSEKNIFRKKKIN